MPSRRPTDRAASFPLIERRYGRPVAHWLRLLEPLRGARYPDQMELLQERHGVSRAHANTLVMYFRGSRSSRRHATPADYLASVDPVAARTVRRVMVTIRAAHPGLELVVAWNQPILRVRGTTKSVFGMSVSRHHALLNPFSRAALTAPPVARRIAALGLGGGSHTLRVPLDWRVDATLLRAMVRVRLAELRDERPSGRRG